MFRWLSNIACRGASGCARWRYSRQGRDHARRGAERSCAGWRTGTAAARARARARCSCGSKAAASAAPSLRSGRADPGSRTRASPGAPGHEIWGRRGRRRRHALAPGLAWRRSRTHGFAEYDVAAAKTSSSTLPAGARCGPVPRRGARLCGQRRAARLTSRRGRAWSQSSASASSGTHASRAPLRSSVGASVTEHVPRGADQPQGEFERVIEAAGTQEPLDLAVAARARAAAGW